MSIRLWLLGLVGLVLVGLLVACGSKYNSSSNGLVLVGSQGSAVIQTYSFDLNSGHVSPIANSTNDTGNKTCILGSSPGPMVMQPDGAYVYVVLNNASQCSNSPATGIGSFQVKSDGKLAQTSNLTADPNPVSLSMDPAGKFLFVAEGSAGLVNVYAIGSGGSLTAVAGTFTFPPTLSTPNIVAVAPTPTVFPTAGLNGVNNSACSGNTPPTSQFLYAVDSVNSMVWEFSVDMSSGALGNPPGQTIVPGFSTDAVPAGVAVDPCDRFVYATGSFHSKISAYTICTQSVVTGPCFSADGTLIPVGGSPFAMSGSINGVGPLVVDPFGNFVYVLGTESNTVSGFKISPTSGSLTALNPATIATGIGPKSITIRQDDNWMFVTNYGFNGQGGNTVSQYSVTPATGALAAAQPIQTDNYPFGVAVK